MASPATTEMQLSEMAYRALLFDVGDTLWHSAEAPPPAEFRRLAAARAREFLGAAGISHADPAKVARVAWDALETAMRRARVTDLVEPNYSEVARSALTALGLTLSTEAAGRLMEAIYVSGEDGGKAAYPDARATLDSLRQRGFELAIVTNRAFGGERFRQDLRAAGLDIAWDAVVISVEVGFLKPHRQIFQTALAELNVTPAQALMVGNSLAEDVAGAQALGIAAAWKRSTPDAESVVPEFTFENVGELLHLAALQQAAR